MLILLPPSETKFAGGSGPAMDLDSLILPALTPVRQTIIDALVRVSQDLPAARTALGVAASKDEEIQRNTELQSAATLPAVQRYTGVLFEALGISTLTKAARSRAGAQIAIGSALFGLVGADDLIPPYRLSAGSRLPNLPALSTLFRPSLGPALKDLDDCVFDLRSGAYAAFAPVPGATTVRVLTEHPDGRRTIVSHHNKATKGLLARALITSRANIGDVRAARKAAARAGLHTELSAPDVLDIIVR